MSFISYAQNFEDVMLWRALRNINNGFYVDVGACDPRENSVTRAFYDRGWRGINIEIDLFYHKRLLSERSRDINLNLAVGDYERTTSVFVVPVTGERLPENAPQQASIDLKLCTRQEVHIQTLNQILFDNAVDPIHFLKIKAAGTEKEVIAGLDFHKWRPWILLINTGRAQSQLNFEPDWDRLILQDQYHLVYQDGSNRFYIADEHKPLDQNFRFPPNVDDDFIQADHFLYRSQATALNKKYISVLYELESVYNSRSYYLANQLRSVVRIIRKICGGLSRRFRLLRTTLYAKLTRNPSRSELDTEQARYFRLFRIEVMRRKRNK